MEILGLKMGKDGRSRRLASKTRQRSIREQKWLAREEETDRIDIKRFKIEKNGIFLWKMRKRKRTTHFGSGTVDGGRRRGFWSCASQA